ncbi:hypothetical protein ACHAW6_015664 [Cyclotella cf. meneghiniana]
MQVDRREVLRKLQQQRQLQRAASGQDEPSFDPTASLVSLRQFNASEYNDEYDDDYNDDDNDNIPRSSEGDRSDLLKLILYDLNSAIAPRDIRLMAIRSAMDEFDHDNEQWHDEELELRADHILLQKLTFAISVDPRHEEVGYICAALEMVYRAGKMRLAKSFHEICEVILPIFVEMIKRPPLTDKKVEEEAVEEEKEEVLHAKDEFRGIEPNENFDPFAPNAYMRQDDDDESAESVAIPAGTGEYFDHMKNMASMGSHQETAVFDQGNSNDSQTLNLVNAEVEVQYRYEPQRQRHYNMPSMGNTQTTLVHNQDIALISQPLNASNPATGEQYSCQPQQQQNMSFMGNHQPTEVFNQGISLVSQPLNVGSVDTGAQYPYQPQQQENMTPVGNMQDAAVFDPGNALVSQPVNLGNARMGDQYWYPQQHVNMAYMANHQNTAALNQSNALVPQPANMDNAGMGRAYQYEHPQAQQQYTPEQLYALAEQISKMQEARQASRQIQFVGVQPGEQQSRYPSGPITSPHAERLTHVQQDAQMVLSSTLSAAPHGQHVPPVMQLERRPLIPSYASTPFVSNQPPEDIVPAPQQLTNNTVSNFHTTDEALRLRGGGDGDSVDDQADYGNYFDENTGNSEQYQEEVTEQYDQLFEGGKQFPSSASYDEYADESEDVDPFLDVSECTGDSEIDSSAKRQDHGKTRTNLDEDEVYNGQVPVNEPGFKKDERREEGITDFATDEYSQCNAEEQRYDGQVAVDRDARVSNNFEPEYSEYADNEEMNNDQPMYDAQGNFALDYSEYFENKTKQYDQPTADLSAGKVHSTGEQTLDGEGAVDRNMRASNISEPDYSEYVDNEERHNDQPLYDSQGNFALDYSEYLENQAMQYGQPTAELNAGKVHRTGEQRSDGQVAVDRNVNASHNSDPEYSEYVGTEEVHIDQSSQGNFASEYSGYFENEVKQQDEPTAQGSTDNENLNKEVRRHDQHTAEFGSDDKLENSNNPFVYSDFDDDDDDAVSNPFVDRSARDAQQNVGTHSRGGQADIKTAESEYGDFPVVGGYENEDEFDSRNIPAYVGGGKIPTHVTGILSSSLRSSNLSNSQGGDDLSYYIGEIDGTPALQDHSKSNSCTTAASAYGADHDPLAQGLENHAETKSRYESNVFVDGTPGQASYNMTYDGSDFGSEIENKAPRSEGWSESRERGENLYTFPTFTPEENNFRSGTGDHWNREQPSAQEFSEGSQSNKLHMVEEENKAQADDHDHDNMSNDDIFQFQEPTMAKPMARENYFSSHDVSEGFVCPRAVRNVLKILRYFSRVLSAMEQLAQQPGLVDALLYQMTRNPLSNQDEDDISARVDAIACLVNLACAEENKIMLVYHPGLLDAVINIANHDPIEEAREHATIVMMNLAYAEENKVHMVNQDNLLDTLVHLLADASPFTRRYASAALFTLACTYANTAVMARHCDGGILEALRKVLLNDPVDEARVNAAEALFNMARNNSDDTVENMGNHPKLLASLAHSVLTDYSADVRAYSARALEWLSADIHHPMKCHPRLLQALTTASQWTKTTCIAEALKMQASIDGNRKSMVEHPGLLDALAQLSLLDGINDDELKTCAISALERLSKEPSTRHLMVRNEGVMTALTRATFAEGGYDDDDDEEEEAPTALLMKTALKNLAEHL